jgi:hypothetical protein
MQAALYRRVTYCAYRVVDSLVCPVVGFGGCGA